ncbi:MAG: NnrU family protein [Hyphomonas sp.]|uniref:NnrU family protein n=1 Tax=Hyphomonas sp. TaxID=87 RepID=UPI00352799C0
MTLFIAGLVIFFGTHVFSALRSREPGKDLKQKLGYGPYMGLYSLVSLAGFVLICMGFGATRGAGMLYTAPDWGRYVNYALMIPALILLVASQLPPGHIKKVARHPMLVAVKLWALGHLLSNGELNSVILFGSFLAYAVFDRIMVKRRGDNGPAPGIPLNAMNDAISVVVGLVAYAAIAHYLHPILFGVPIR